MDYQIITVLGQIAIAVDAQDVTVFPPKRRPKAGCSYPVYWVVFRRKSDLLRHWLWL